MLVSQCGSSIFLPTVGREEFTSDHNKNVSSHLVREVKSLHPETSSSIIQGMVNIVYTPAFKRDAIIAFREIPLQCPRMM